MTKLDQLQEKVKDCERSRGVLVTMDRGFTNDWPVAVYAEGFRYKIYPGMDVYCEVRASIRSELARVTLELEECNEKIDAINTLLEGE